MKTLVKAVLVLLLVPVLGFCAFGFLATFEPLPATTQWTWRLIYSAGALFSVIAAAGIWRAISSGPR